MLKNKKQKKPSFTLAETLITITIIGVVAVIIIGYMTNSMEDRARTRQTAIAKHKFAKAIENMAMNYDIGPYYGTGAEKYDATNEFTDKLRKYYKINQICTTTNLDDCWGYETINFPSGEKYDIKNATNGKLFKYGGNENVNDGFDNETRGMFAVDGTRFIIAFDKYCTQVEPQVFVWSNDGTSHNGMGCVAAILDIDGNKAPNRVGKDISFINATGLGDNCIIKIGEACFGLMFEAPPVSSYEECINNKNAWGLTYCMGEDYRLTRERVYYTEKGGDYYAGAIKACGNKENLPTREDIQGMFNLMYKTKGTNEFTDYIEGSASKLGLMEPLENNKFSYIWLNDEEPLYGGTFASVASYSKKKASTTWTTIPRYGYGTMRTICKQ